MEVRTLDDARAFLDAAGPLMLVDEARHNLQLGIAGTLVSTPDRYTDKRFWVVHDGDEVVAAALQTPPFNILVVQPRDDAALGALVAGIDVDLPGVVGAHPEVEVFTELWTESRRLTRRVLREQGVYALEQVQPVPDAPGASRSASGPDLHLLVEWMVAFGDEVLEEDDPGRIEARQGVEHRLTAQDQGGFLLWEDEGEIVSMSGWGAPTPNGIRIGPVYTPPPLRGRGYATTLVAELSQTLLDGGRRFCFLFTDLANPTSNAIYERIGYVKSCEAAMIAFDSTPKPSK
jgi:predicted GNAT family acetyltransferase